MDGENELFHYTGEGGLVGILSTGKIWATRYDYMNDSSEMHHLGSVLLTPFCMYMHKYLSSEMLKNEHIAKLIQSKGGVDFAAKNDSAHFMSILGASVFGAIAPTYITSFCTHDDEYESKNGLLSQWRGYGGAGYAIVFDRDEIEEAVKEERDSFAYQTIFMKEANYDVEKMMRDNKFDGLLSIICDSWEKAINNDESAFRDAFEPFAIESACVKHRGFKEEREVRIVSAPLTVDVLEAFKKQDSNFDPGKPLKDILQRDHPRGNPKALYIELFSHNAHKINPKRIIVGPGKDQDQRVGTANIITNGSVPVHISETPFI